ncbi:hypothetical protein Barb7_02281 [Bacteroidales bacterium Barb7]|nr:hypothetical protein Barb7_02281 [Bacteroidales bacterium Barb7]
MLPRHTRQLPVRTVIDVRPNEQCHADNVHQQIIEVKQNPRRHTDKDRGNGDHIGRHAQLLENQRMSIPDRAVEPNINKLLRIRRFERRYQTRV